MFTITCGKYHLQIHVVMITVVVLICVFYGLLPE